MPPPSTLIGEYTTVNLAGGPLSLPSGRSGDFTLQAQNRDGTYPAIFTGAPAPTAAIWQGNAQSPLLTPAVAWRSNGSDAVVVVSFYDTDTAGWDLGSYELEVVTVLGGRTVRVAQASLEITESPGTGVARPNYCQYSDMLKWAPWIGDIQQPNQLQGFADQRADARTWFDNIVLRCYRGGGWGNYEFHSAAAFAYAGGGPQRQIGKSHWLSDQLAANKLMVLPEVTNVNAWYAIFLACNGAVARGDTFVKHAARFFAMADNGIKSMTAQIDVSGTGYYAVAIPLGSTDPLFT